MSIVAEVLNTASEAEILSLTAKMSEISQSVASLRGRVRQFMETKYLMMLKGKGGEKSSLAVRATEVAENIKELQTRLEYQTKTESSTIIEELRSTKESLVEARVMCEITRKLLKIDEEFEAAFTDQKSLHYFSAACHIVKVQEMLSKDNGSELDFLQIYDPMKFKCAANYSMFCSEALKMWKTQISWVVCQLDSTTKTVTLQVPKSKDLSENLIQTLNVFGVSERQVYYFSQSFNTDILISCITYKTTVSSKLKGDNAVLFTSSDTQEKPTVSEVLDNLTKVFGFLDMYMNLTIDASRKFISDLGLHLAENFLAVFIRDCLSDAIPYKRQDLPSYQGLVNRIIEFNELLGRVKFLPEGNDQLEKFCGNVEEQFLSKTIERYLTRAREISRTMLHDMIPVHPKMEDAGAESAEFETNKVKKEPCFQFTELPNDFGEFPSCQVSKNVLELMKLVQEILTDCVSSDHPIPNIQLKLFCTARDCINLYVELTPVIHIKLLESLPQQSALFHNNCFYIAHELITLNEPFRSKYNDQVTRVLGTFVDMVNYIRSQGLKALGFQVNKQNSTILDIISQSGLSKLAEEDVPPMLEKSLRQCVHQFTFLQTMWQNVLPIHVYNKIMSQLCNSFLEEVINRVLFTKDIKAATAEHLVRCFGHVQDNLPIIFDEPKEIHRHVKKWSKFTELIHVLKGSLAEIGDRWADGKGPLALEFSPEQVRKLIKALFQVSDRRTAILSRIQFIPQK